MHLGTTQHGTTTGDTMTTEVAPLADTLPADLTAADHQRAALAFAALAPHTRRGYESAWSAWQRWALDHGHQVMPAAPASLAQYVAARHQDGAAVGSLRVAVAAVVKVHAALGHESPTTDGRVRDALKIAGRESAGRGRGQAVGLSLEDVAAIIATADMPRRTGRGVESAEAAAERGATDKALTALLFMAGLRRSEAAALRWGDVADGTDGGMLVTVRRSKTDQDGQRADVRYLVNGCARAVRMLRDRLTVQAAGMRPAADAPVLGGLNGQSIARRLTAAAQAAGITGRITGHSGRVGLAQELTRRKAPEQAIAHAGGWQSSRMVTHYSAGVRAEQGAVAEYLR